jgi:hypothetical protein
VSGRRRVRIALFVGVLLLSPVLADLVLRYAGAT